MEGIEKEDNPQVKQLTVKQIHEMLETIADGKMEEKINDKVGSIVSGTQKDMRDQLEEVRELTTMLRDHYNRDSRNRPLRKIAKETDDYIEHVQSSLKLVGDFSPCL